MAVYDLEEQEQLSELKLWWQRYGNFITTAITLAALAVAGFQAWNWYQRNQSAQAAAVYYALQKAVVEKDAKKVRETAGELLDKFPRTAYASLGAMLAAKMQFDAGDLKTARAQLNWVADNARDAELRDLARLRLAGVMLDDQAYDEALKLLSIEPLAAYVVSYAEMKGDILAAQNKRAEARTAYSGALAKLDEAQKKATSAEAQRDTAYRDVLQIKLESLGADK